MRTRGMGPSGDSFKARHTVTISIGVLLLFAFGAIFLIGHEMYARRGDFFTLALIAAIYPALLFLGYMATKHWRRASSMEAEAKATQVFLRNILNHVADPIFVKDRQHRWISGNTAFWKLMNMPESALIGKSDYEFFPKEQADVFWEKDEEVFTTGKPNINIERLTDPAGVTHILSTKKACFTSPSGEPILVGIIRDVTELTAAQAKLKQSDDARLKAIMDHSGLIMYIKNLEGRYMQCNKELLALIKCEEKDIIGKSDYDFFPKEYADTYRKNDRAVAQTGSPMEFEELSPTPDGIHVYHSVKFPLYDAADRVYATCGITTDITNRKRAEQELNRYMQALERSNQELDDFAYIASHDLKEPLRGLYNHASFLIEDYQDKLGEDGVKRLKRLSYLAKRMEQLVSDLLYFSRLGRTELAIQDTDPNAIIEDIRQLLDTTLQDRKVKIEVPQPMPSIICDRPRITEVFRNLITNAIKYNDKPEPRVEIGFLSHVPTAKGTEHNVFYVRDNGIGIEADFYDEVFRIFKRLQKDAEEKEPGTGAGLTFVKKIVERHGGRIWLESVPGKGTTFYFNLNRREQRHEQLAA